MQRLRLGLRRFSSATDPAAPTNRHLAWVAGAAGLGLGAGYWYYRKQKQESAKNVVLPVREGAFVLDSLKDTGVIRDEMNKRQFSLKPEPKQLKTKYLLIGGGLASFAALETILAQDKDADVLMVTEESYPPYMKPPLSKELWYNHEKARELDEQFEFADWHGERKPIFFQDLGFFEENVEETKGSKPKLMRGKRAVSIDVAKKTVTLHDGTIITFEKALVATGSTPRNLDYCTDPDVTNVTYLRSIADFKGLRHAVDKIDKLAIIGGGFVGSELAASVASYSAIERPDRPVKIVQIFPEEGNMGLVFPKYLSGWVMKQLRALGIEIWPNSSIKSITRPSEGKVRITTSTKGEDRIIDADHVVVAIGSEPNVALGKDSGWSLDQSEFGGGAIKVSPTLEIVPEVVFGAGDAISYFDRTAGVDRSVHHYDHALSSGRLAGYNMVQKDSDSYAPYTITSLFWSDLGPTVGYEAVGLVDSSLTTVGVWAKGGPQDTPQQAELDPKDIRREVVGQTSPGSAAPVSSESSNQLEPSMDFRKGLVLYVKDRMVVGFLMFNLFNRTALAKNILKQRMTVDDLQGIVDLFNINE